MSRLKLAGIIAGVFVVGALVGRPVSQREPSAEKPEANDTRPPDERPDIAPTATGERMWVTAQYLDRHTCPRADCGVVGRLMFREAADVVERRGGWARVSRRYDASCAGGRSEYIDKGDAACDRANGIEDGQFAEWVRIEHLSATRPTDPAASATNREQLVKDSDDFRQHRQAFVRATEQLIADGRCTEADFREMGGWVKSTNYRDAPVYFTYCGGMTLANKLHLDAQTGRIFR